MTVERMERLVGPVIPGSARSVLASGVQFLQPEETVLKAMLTGWAAQQTSRCLSPITVEKRDLTVRRFVSFTNEYPWRWNAADAEEWSASMVATGLSHATLRNYQQTVALFLVYLCDFGYDWATCAWSGSARIRPRFSIRATWPHTAHRTQSEGRPTKRPFSREEALAFFTFCDRRVAAAAHSRHKGWLAAYRDSALFKVIYAWGLRHL